MKRRNIASATPVLAMVAAAALVLAACGGEGEATPEPAPDGEGSEQVSGEFDWRAQEGQTIELLMNQHPWQQAIQSRIGEFEELTGITVEVRALPEDQMRQRLQVEMSTQTDSIDVFMTGALAEGRLFESQGWYEDLNTYVNDDSMISPDYAPEDFTPDLIDEHTIDGNLIGLPIQIETAMLYYRTDMLADLGLEPPTTVEELENVARTVTEETDSFGFVGRGRGAAATSQFSPFLYAFGAEWNDENGQAAFDTPEGIEAFEFYGNLVREYGPAGAANNSWEETMPIFQQGNAAMFVDASVFAPQILDPDQSTVTENVGFLPIPSGPGGDTQAFWGWALGMSPFSQAKEASWYFIQWATSPDVVKSIQETDGIAGGRTSVTEFPDFLPQEWVDAFTESRANSRSQHPTIVPVPEARDILGNAIVTAIEGGDVQAAVADAAERFNALGD